MTEHDLDRVMEIEKASFPSPWRRSFFASDIPRPDGMCLTAEDDGEVVGYLVAWGREEVHLANLAVAELRRRQGVGRRLMEELMRAAAAQGGRSLYLEVRASNAGARKFYAGLGFVPTFVRRGYYENGEDAVVMERELGPEDAARLGG